MYLDTSLVRFKGCDTMCTNTYVYIYKREFKFLASIIVQQVNEIQELINFRLQLLLSFIVVWKKNLVF